MLEIARADIRVLNRVVFVLIAAELLFVALNIWPTPSAATNRALNLDHESNIVVWFASAQLLALSFLTFLLYSKLRARGWLLLALGFLFLSVDETASLHESYGASLYHQYISSNYQNGDWLIFFSVPLLIGAFLCAHAWWKLRQVSRPSFLWGTAGLLCWISVLAFESQGSKLRSAVIAEEFLELFGATLMLFATGRALVQDAPLSKSSS